MYFFYLINGSLLSKISGVLCSCEYVVDEGGDGGVARGEGPLHCISLLQCSALAISALNQLGSSGKIY